MRYFEELVKVVDRVIEAEKIAPRGSHDGEMITKAALYQAWGAIHTFVQVNRAEQGFPQPPNPPAKYRMDGSADWQS